MTSHLVKCLYCGEKFDTNLVKYEKVNSTRYAHLACAEREKARKTKEENDKKNLEEYIKSLLNEDFINIKVKKQLKEYREEFNYTYSGMLKTLKYFYEIKGNNTDKAAGGIGIIPHVYKEANQYYYALWIAQQKNVNKDIKKYKPIEEEVHIKTPERDVHKNIWFKFLDNDEEIKDEF